MNNIFVVDKDTKEHIANIDFIPRKEERIIVNKNNSNIEYKVKAVVYNVSINGTIVFVELVQPYYSNIIKDIKW